MEQYKKDPIVFLIINIFTLYIPWFMNCANFFNSQKPDAKLNWIVDWLLTMCTCAIGWLFVVFPKYSQLLDEQRQAAGLQPKNLGFLHAFIGIWGVYEVIVGINEVVEAKSAQPQA